jgi:hypothetical protein
VSNAMKTQVMRCFVLLLFGFSGIVIGTYALAQVGRAEHMLTVAVSRVQRNQYGYLITVEIVNASDHRLFLPQAPG